MLGQGLPAAPHTRGQERYESLFDAVWRVWLSYYIVWAIVVVHLSPGIICDDNCFAFGEKPGADGTARHSAGAGAQRPARATARAGERTVQGGARNPPLTTVYVTVSLGPGRSGPGTEPAP